MRSDTGPSASGPVERVRTAVSRRIRIDTRTLAVFRVAVGLLILADLLLRARNFSYFYTEAGVVPQWLAMEAAPENAVSVYYLTTDPTLIGALFVVQALIAVQLVVGYRTRIAAVLSFLFVISLDHHNPLVLSHADVLFRLLLFWALFLPLGERWSVDAVHAGEPRPYVASAASALILLQMVYMYVFNGYHKSYSELWTGGEATVLIMGLDNTTYLLGDLMRNVPTLLQYGGLTWYYMLLSAWLLVVLQGRTRLLFVGMFMAGHASFILTVRIGAFGYVALAGLSLFLQAQFWKDGKTLLRCAGVEGGRFRAVRGELQSVGGRFPDLRLGSGTYRSAKSLLYDVTLGVVVVTIALLIGVSLLQTGGVVDEEFGHDQQIENVAASLAIDQPEWTVFAPTPRTMDRYYVFPAKTADGEVIDAYNDRPLSYERPHDELQKQFGTYRERFYMNSVRRGGSDGVVPTTLADHKCERWYEDRGIEITHLNMYTVTEDVTRETIDAPDEREREVTLINKHGCGDNEPKEIEPPDR